MSSINRFNSSIKSDTTELLVQSGQQAEVKAEKAKLEAKAAEAAKAAKTLQNITTGVTDRVCTRR